MTRHVHINRVRSAHIAAATLFAIAALCYGARPAHAAERAFIIAPPIMDEPASPSHQETAVFAGGCFWGVQGVFQHVKGVSQALSGYAGGKADTAHYDNVSMGDTGPQYRSTIFAANSRQHEIAQAYIAQLDKSGVYSKPLATTIEDHKNFYPAEAYHQDYLVQHPDSLYIVFNDMPKIANLAKVFGERYRDQPVLVNMHL